MGRPCWTDVSAQKWDRSKSAVVAADEGLTYGRSKTFSFALMISFKRSSARKHGAFYHLTNKICIFFPCVAERPEERGHPVDTPRRCRSSCWKSLRETEFPVPSVQRRRGRLQRARFNESKRKLLISAISILPPSLSPLAHAQVHAHSRFPISADL